MAKIAHGLYRGGFLSGVSVGFVPIKWQDPSPQRSSRGNEAPIPSTTLPSARSSRGEEALISPEAQKATNPPDPPRRIYLEQELLEVSAVAIPANPNALALAYKSGAVEKSDLKELSTLLNCTLSATSCSGSKSAIGNRHSQIAAPSPMQFLRALHSLLRKT